MLFESEIRVGVVAVLDPSLLEEDPSVLRPASAVDRAGPFVCIEVSGHVSSWLPLTSKKGGRAGRIEVPRSLRRGGEGVWTTGPCFVHPMLSTYVGPHRSFCESSHPHDAHRPATRPSIEMEWVRSELFARAQQQGSKLARDHTPRALASQPSRTAVALPPPATLKQQLLTPEQVRRVAVASPPPPPAPPEPALAPPKAWFEQIGEPPPDPRRDPPRGRRR
jgi:hypothetical protein